MKIKVDISHAGKELENVIDKKVAKINSEVVERATAAGNEIRNQVLKVLSGNRSGRVYHFINEAGTNTVYTASAPGEPPAVRTGFLRNSFEPKSEIKKSGKTTTVKAYAVSNTTKSASGGKGNSNVNYAWIDQGMGRVAPRPYARKVLFNAMDVYLKQLRKSYNA